MYVKETKHTLVESRRRIEATFGILWLGAAVHGRIRQLGRANITWVIVIRHHTTLSRAAGVPHDPTKVLLELHLCLFSESIVLYTPCLGCKLPVSISDSDCPFSEVRTARSTCHLFPPYCSSSFALIEVQTYSQRLALMT